jgi:hypothetical protein
MATTLTRQTLVDTNRHSVIKVVGSGGTDANVSLVVAANLAYAINATGVVSIMPSLHLVTVHSIITLMLVVPLVQSRSQTQQTALVIFYSLAQQVQLILGHYSLISRKTVVIMIRVKQEIQQPSTQGDLADERLS